MPLELLSKPRENATVSMENGILQFRHPWINSTDGYGLKVCRSFKRLSYKEQGTIRMQAEELLASHPLKRNESPTSTDLQLLEAYFTPLEQLLKAKAPYQHFEVDAAGHVVVDGLCIVPEDIPEAVNTPAAQMARRLATEVETRDHIIKKLHDRVASLETEVEDYKRLLAEQERRQNKHCRVTLEEALKAFEKDYSPGREQTRTDLLATVKNFIYGKTLRGEREVLGIGPKTRLSDVTPIQIDRWLDQYPTESRVTVIHLRAHISTFFSNCKRLYELSTTPFDSGRLKERGDLLTLARKRAPEAIKRVPDLMILLDGLKSQPYWQSWVAFACLAGPRWSEQRSLTLSNLDLEAQPPRAIIQETDESEIKTRGNAVPIEKKLLLPILRNYLPVKPPGPLIWPSLVPNRDRKKSSNEDDGPEGSWSHSAFERRQKTAFEIAKVTSSDPGHVVWSYGPAQWRHTFGTLLALAGFNTMEIARMMRNSSEVAGAHYINFSPIDERVKDQLDWNLWR